MLITRRILGHFLKILSKIGRSAKKNYEKIVENSQNPKFSKIYIPQILNSGKQKAQIQPKFAIVIKADVARPLKN